MTLRPIAGALALALATLGAAGCTGGGTAASVVSDGKIPVTITTAGGKAHVFRAEIARTVEEQARGLMFRTDLAKDSAMLFTPYPADGGPPREASFWMKNTPTSLDIVYIREDGTIARIAENTIPFSELPLPSGEPVNAVLEIVGGRAAELGIGEGDRVAWQK